MASIVTPNDHLTYVDTSMAMETDPHTSTLLQSSSLLSSGRPLQATSDPQPPSILDSLSVLNSGSSNGHGVVGVARDNVMSLSHVLSGLQEEGDLAEVLQDQPNLAHGLNSIALGDVSSDPESLRFQFQAVEEQLLHHQQHSSSKPPKKKGKTVYREQDRFLPLHNVARAMRNAIPSNGKVSKDAKECMQECVSECISFITSEASDKCIAERRKTITGDDILFAMATLGFDNYIEPLRLYLQKYREFSRTEKSAPNLATPVDSFPLVDSAPVTIGHTHSTPAVSSVPSLHL